MKTSTRHIIGDSADVHSRFCIIAHSVSLPWKKVCIIAFVGMERKAVDLTDLIYKIRNII
jgi:hypothetical protein